MSTCVAHNIFLISDNSLETISKHFDLFLINKDDNQHVSKSCIGSVNMEAFMAITMSTDCFREKMNTILKQFLTSLLLLTSNITTRLDYKPLFGRGARTPPRCLGEGPDQTRESGGNQAYITTIVDVRLGTWITTNLSSYATLLLLLW